MFRTRRSRIARRRGRCLALAVTLVLVGRRASAQVAVDELEVHLSLRPGATRLAGTFHAANPTDGPVNATISVADWDRSDRGENRYYPLGTLPGSCGPHVKVFPSVLRLEPRSVQAIQVIVDSADAVPRECHAILFVESAPMRGLSASGLAYTVRYGVKVYAERDVPPSAEVVAMSMERRVASAAPNDSAWVLDLAFHNSGGRQTETHGSVEVRRLDNSVVKSVDVAEFPTLPGATRKLSVRMPSLPSGRYVVLALLDYGGGEIAAGQASLEVP